MSQYGNYKPSFEFNVSAEVAGRLRNCNFARPSMILIGTKSNILKRLQAMIMVKRLKQR